MNGIHSEQIIQLVHNYGYFGLAGILILGIVGLPLPDETILTAVGYLVYRGHLSYFPALFAGISGASVGITISFLIGVLVGRPLILVYGRYLHITEKKLQTIEKYFDRYGGITLIVGFFIPGVRHLTAIVAGLGGMKLSRFMIAAYTGVCLWVTTFITLGRFVGQHITTIRMHAPYDIWYLIGISTLGVVITWFAGFRLRQYRRRRKA